MNNKNSIYTHKKGATFVIFVTLLRGGFKNYILVQFGAKRYSRLQNGLSIL